MNNDETRMTNDETNARPAQVRDSPGICFVIRISSFVIVSLFEISLFAIRPGAGSQFELGVITVPANPARRVPQFPAALRAGSRQVCSLGDLVDAVERFDAFGGTGVREIAAE